MAVTDPISTRVSKQARHVDRVHRILSQCGPQLSRDLAGLHPTNAVLTGAAERIRINIDPDSYRNLDSSAASYHYPETTVYYLPQHDASRVLAAYIHELIRVNAPQPPTPAYMKDVLTGALSETWTAADIRIALQHVAATYSGGDP